jgi:hypothetical protein
LADQKSSPVHARQRHECDFTKGHVIETDKAMRLLGTPQRKSRQVRHWLSR